MSSSIMTMMVKLPSGELVTAVVKSHNAWGKPDIARSLVSATYSDGSPVEGDDWQSVSEVVSG